MKELLCAIAGAAALAGSSPGLASGPVAFALLLAGLMAWFLLATAASRPVWSSYVFGAVHMAIFAWSVRHIMVPVYVFIVVVGAAYYALATVATRAVPDRWRWLAFAAASAAAFWLRGNMPEIYFPHGQPCHALAQQPALLFAVVLGGEPLANALLALLAAAAVQCVRSWRVGVPRGRAAARGALVAVGVAIACTALGAALHATVGEASPARVRIAAIEPGYHPKYELFDLPRSQFQPRMLQLLRERLVEPTRAELLAADVPDLVLWPESIWLPEEPLADVEAGTLRLLEGVFPAAATRLLIGGNVRAEDQPLTPAAFLLGLPDGRVLGHQEKQCLVPGGEFPPLLGWLPAAWSQWLIDQFEQVLGSLPVSRPGRSLPPLRTAAGVPFGMLMCYDNAFPGPAAAQVAAGARFLCVLSNESWFEAGAELPQLVAMTVVRALETATPLVRCTQDGQSVAVGADGRLLAELPVLPSPQPAARILRVELPLGTGRVPPMAWLRAACGPGLAALLLAMLTHGLLRWAKLRAARTASRAVGESGDPGR